MKVCSYRPGTGLLLMGAEVVALVATDSKSELGEQLISLWAQRPTAEQVVDVLELHGLRSLPSFALAFHEGERTRLLVRGTATAVVIDPSGTHQYSAERLTSWREELVESDQIELVLAQDGTDAADLWLSEGVVLASSAQLFAAPRLLTRIQPGPVAGQAPPAPPPTTPPPTPGPDGGQGEPQRLASMADSLPLSIFSAITGADQSLDQLTDEDGNRTLILTPGAEEVASDSGAAVDDLDLAVDLGLINMVDRTMFRTPEAAAMRSDESAASDVVPAPDLHDRTAALLADIDDGGDHDGFTIARPRRDPGPQSPTPAPSSAVHIPPRPAEVMGVRCGGGHLNSPIASNCRVCGLVIVERTPTPVVRPVMGVLVFNGGRREPVDAPLLVGRIPPPGAHIDGEVGRAVVIDDPEISRLHAAVHVRDWIVSVSDQNSSNGTTIRLPGEPPRTLRPYEPFILLDGAVVDLGGATTFQYFIEER